ncbi:hypothetical protein M422DRAFT_27904 [Sphaerobolus stellatus SS14]|nr:hypothetical protein M422DRAFT_27904 [Sphaerobolus stellatus SS14]
MLAPIQRIHRASSFLPLSPPASLSPMLDPVHTPSRSNTRPARSVLSIAALTSDARKLHFFTQPPRPALLHDRSSTPSTSICISSPEPPSSPESPRRVDERVNSPPPALALLAAVCSSTNIRWDGGKQSHYMDGSPNTPDKASFKEREVSRISYATDDALAKNTSDQGNRGTRFITDSPIAEELPVMEDGNMDGIEEWEEEDLSEHEIPGTHRLPVEFAASSPTAFSHSSPPQDVSCGYSSSSERSATLPASSPILQTLKKVSVHRTKTPSRLHSPEASMMAETVRNSPVILSISLEPKVEVVDVPLPEEAPEDSPMDDLTAEHSEARPPSLSPSLAPSRIKSLPSSLELSPLSSLVSSPLTEPFDEEPPSAISSHFALESSALSSRSSSPDLADMDPSPISRIKGRRASLNIIHTPSRKGVDRHTLRFDTAPPEPTPRKRRRRSSPSSPLPRPLQMQRTSSPLSPPPPSPKAVKASTSKVEEKPRVGRPPKGKPKQHPESMAISKPKRGRPKGTKNKVLALKEENTDVIVEEHPSTDLLSLPMTGFLVETLALSRASAMAAPELLRAVLKSQPHLIEERKEKDWLPQVRAILRDVNMFGRIERTGLDAADKPLEDHWFYIPENDAEEGRAELLKGIMPKKRAVTKSSKQYYFEPIGKHSRWDPEDD